MSVKFSAYAAGLANLPLPIQSGDAVIASRAGTDYQISLTGITSTLSFPISLQSGGVEFAQFTNPAQNVVQLVGEGNGLTTAIHLNPGPGALATGTITEFVMGRTASQAFGGNYGRWSLSNFAPLQSGIVGEFGGSVPPVSFNVQVGIENPPNTFTSFEGWRFQTTVGTAEDDNQGSVAFGLLATVPRNQITLAIANIGSAGQRDSHAVLWEGKANDGTERAVWWRMRVHPTNNNGTSSFILQQNLNGGGWTTPWTVGSDGSMSLTGAFQATGGIAVALSAGAFTLSPRTIHTGGVGGTLATSMFTAQTPVATEVYAAEVFIPANMIITGIALLNSGTISGNVKVGLCDAGGNVVATSGSVAQAGTNVFQLIPFTSPLTWFGPSRMYVVVFFDNNTTRPWAHTVGAFGTGVLTGQVYATGFVSNALLAPTAFVTAIGPVATLY